MNVYEWVTVALLLGLVFLVVLPVYLKRPRRPRIDVRAMLNQELCDRADKQHELWLSGDPKGLYGNYPPAVLPD